MTLLEPDRAAAAAEFVVNLGAHGHRVAVVTADEAITYAELDERVDEVAAGLGGQRRLVLIGAGNTTEPLVAYLAALRGGHPVLLVPGDDGGARRDLAAAYDPDVVIAASGGWEVEERRSGSAHDLHPDLALLLSTSGSTGSSKLVRLSHRNLQANAASIAQYLEVGPGDRAATTLPMQYCYGLSVVNSHLLRGAGLVLTDLSVVDACFWDLFRAAGATSFAGVPHTFDLLDRVGFDAMSLPSLRYVTQAGGRLHADKVRRYAALGARDGWRFFVMYGQTEATARMAYLPPDKAATHPHAIGVPIPGGALRIDAPDGDGVGELVYQGPNVMLGYAERPSDLSLGATLDQLHTGDLARLSGSGLYELVGRRSRFVKLFGVRIELDGVERLLADQGVPAMCTGDDEQLVVALGPGHDGPATAQLLGNHLGVPLHRIRVVEVDELPRGSNGKPDYALIRLLAAEADGAPVEPPLGHRQADHEAAVLAAFAEVLGTDASPEDSFVSLGGDSLSYVEMSIRLERILGFLPPDWHTTPIGRLSPAPDERRATRQIETSVVVRAVAIVLIVGTHATLWRVPGGAHVLLGVAGYNFARFQLRAPTSTVVASVARVAVPSMVWIGAVAAVTDRFRWTDALLLNSVLGVPDGPREYWFIQSIVLILLPMAALFASRRLRALERRWPFSFAVAAVTAALAFRFQLFDLDVSLYRLSRPHEIFWLFALGWAAARATTLGRRLVVSALVVAAVPGFFGSANRDMVVIGGLLLVVWLRTVAVPQHLGRLVGVVAGASLYIYLTHWQVYPTLLRLGGPLVASVGSVLVGVGVWCAARPVVTMIEGRFSRAGGAPPALCRDRSLP